MKVKDRFGFLLFDEVEELDLVGPWEIMGLWSKNFQGPKELVTVSEKGDTVRCAKGLRIASDYSFATCPQLNYLLVPGGFGTRKEVNNKILIDFIRNQAAHCDYVLSVCTGAFLLQAAGLLKGLNATTHWASLERLKQFPELHIKEQRYVKNQKIWTAAGISAGIDMSLAFIAEITNAKTAGNVQLFAEYFPEGKCYAELSSVPDLPGYLKDSSPHQ